MGDIILPIPLRKIIREELFYKHYVITRTGAVDPTTVLTYLNIAGRGVLYHRWKHESVGIPADHARHHIEADGSSVEGWYSIDIINWYALGAPNTNYFDGLAIKDWDTVAHVYATRYLAGGIYTYFKETLVAKVENANPTDVATNMVSSIHYGLAGSSVSCIELPSKLMKVLFKVGALEVKNKYDEMYGTDSIIVLKTTGVRNFLEVHELAKIQEKTLRERLARLVLRIRWDMGSIRTY